MGRNRKERRQKLAEEREDEGSDSGGLELTEEEQWRLVNETGILKKLPAEPSRPTQPSDEDEDEVSPFAEEIFQTTCFAIPMSFMLLLMEM